MTDRTLSFPLPDPAIRDLPLPRLAEVARTTLRRVYGVEIDGTPAGITRLDDLLHTRFRFGLYTRETYPAMLAFTLGAFLGDTLLRRIDGGQWGDPEENLYGTPLPFLIFVRSEYARQVNAVEDAMTLFWTGDGLLPGAYLAHFMEALDRLGFSRAA